TNVTLEDIPPEVVEAAKLHLLDVLGCGYASSALDTATEGRTAMAELGGEPQASVIGYDGALPAPNAAFANAMLCHGLDFDDTHSDSVSHVSAVVGPASLAAAEAAGADGRELRCGRAPERVRGEVRPLSRLHRAASRSRASARRPRLPLGDAPHRLQGVSRLSFHPRLARGDRDARRRDRPGRDRGRARVDP